MRGSYRLSTDRYEGEGSGNNYAYLVTDDSTRDAVIIDPAHPPAYVKGILEDLWKLIPYRVLPQLAKAVDSGSAIKNIINTHQYGYCDVFHDLVLY